MRKCMSQRIVSTKYAGRMRKIDMIRRVDWILLPATIAMLASSVQLEATAGLCSLGVGPYLYRSIFLWPYCMASLATLPDRSVGRTALEKQCTRYAVDDCIDASYAYFGDYRYWRVDCESHAFNCRSTPWKNRICGSCRGGVAYRTPNQVLPPEMMCSDVDSIYVIG